MFNFSRIKRQDNFLSDNDFLYIKQECLKLEYVKGEVDRPGTLPTGLVSELYPSHSISVLIDQQLRKKKLISKLKLNRIYVNLFLDGEIPNFHTDSSRKGDLTAIYYLNEPNDTGSNLGCTEFKVRDHILGIPPVENRVVVFDSTIEHRATSFSGSNRYAIALKYVKSKIIDQVHL